MVWPLRKADLKAAQNPDYFVTISEYAKDAIKKYYGRESVVIHPPVEIDDFKIKSSKKQTKQGNKTTKKQGVGSAQVVENLNLAKTYITTARQVNWKRLDLAVKACLMTQRHLVVIGEGPEHRKLVKMAEGSDLIKFLPLMKKEELAVYLAQAKGYLFPSLEPFGIAPVEALAAGCPVIGFAEGGSRDYIKDGENGILFKEQTAKSLAEAILKFEKMKFDREKISKTADGFGVKRFDTEIVNFVKEKTGKKNAKDK
jgi:glycosyltransferase involved in cell wall biosynthesis